MSNDQPVQSTSSTEGQDNVKTDSILPDSTMTCFIPKTETSEMDKDKYSKEQYCDEEIFPKLRIKTTELLENMTKEEMESLTLKKLRMLLCNIMPEYYDYMMRSETKNFLKDIFGKVFQSINKKHSDEVENKREADKNLRIKTGRDTNPNSNDGQKHAKMTIESTVEKIDADSHLLPNVLLKQKARKSKPKKSTHINADECVADKDELHLYADGDSKVKPKRHRHNETIRKLEAIEWAEKFSINSAAINFGVARSCVRDWIRKKDQLKKQYEETTGSGKRMRLDGGGRKVRDYENDLALAKWVKLMCENKQLISKNIIRNKAFEFFGNRMKISDGWLQKFLKRHHLIIRDHAITPVNSTEAMANFIIPILDDDDFLST